MASAPSLTRQRAHFETSVMVGPFGEPMEISSHLSSANGPPPSNTMLGRNLKRWMRLSVPSILLCLSALSFHRSYWFLKRSTHRSTVSFSSSHLSWIFCVPTSGLVSLLITSMLSSDKSNIGYMSWKKASAFKSGKSYVASTARGRGPL